MLEETATLLGHSSEVLPEHEIVLDTPDTPVHVFADPNQMKQITWNLARNALQAMPSGGKLVMSLARNGAGEVVMAFRDEGVGMPGGEVNKVFEPFSGSFDRGSGLGLAIVYRIVKDYNGLELFEHIRAVAITSSTVLITGESGTGKELAARAIHVGSPRASEPFVSINCGAVPETLLESELFGHLKGSFTGAITNHKGLFEVAHRGTIFLDEIAEMTSNGCTVKLLRVRAGKARSAHRLDRRDRNRSYVILSATIQECLEQERPVTKSFREDLYYRLNVIPIHLNLRCEIVVTMCRSSRTTSSSRARESMGKNITKIADEAVEMTHELTIGPFNVRRAREANIGNARWLSR